MSLILDALSRDARYFNLLPIRSRVASSSLLGFASGSFSPRESAGDPKLSRGPRRPPIISKKQQQRRRAIVVKLVSRIDDFREELQTCASEGRRKEIVAELKQLRREQSRLSLAEREPKAAPLPSSYVERVKADRKARARLSGRDKIRVHFVQGGAPGTAK